MSKAIATIRQRLEERKRERSSASGANQDDTGDDVAASAKLAAIDTSAPQDIKNKSTCANENHS